MDNSKIAQELVSIAKTLVASPENTARRLYVVMANVVLFNPERKSRMMVQIPTFFLDADVQGIMSDAKAERVAKEIVGSLAREGDEVHVSVALAD